MNLPEIKQAPTLEAKKSTKTTERDRRTICIELKLFEPTADDYPEFYVPELIQRERRKWKKKAEAEAATPDTSFAQPFNNDSEDDEDVHRLARKMNEKYGNGSGYEINDKAVGYDESDSFIDNTEAFDEMIMDDTPRGGFYINSGPLVFKQKEKGGSATGKKRTSVDTEDEGKQAKKKFRSEHKKKKDKVKEPEDNGHGKEKVKTMAIKDVLRLQRDNALKKANRIVSDEEDSEVSRSSGTSSEDSDVKIVEPTSNSLPPGLPDSILNIITEFKNSSDEVKLQEFRNQIDSSGIPPDTREKVHSYLNSLKPAPPIPTAQPPVSTEVKEPGLDLPLLD